MAVNLHNIKRWFLMLSGKSLYHVDQGIGKFFVPGELKGYFNDMTQKVIKGDNNLTKEGIPFLEHEDGSHIEMPTMIFQYGIGAYDLWLSSGKRDYLLKAIRCADWGINHQQNNGAWNNFYYIYPNNPYSAMPQGEAVSLLVRIYRETNDRKYMEAAQKALDYMLTDINDGGVTDYSDDKITFLEYTHLPVVLNGWIFAIFGIYDFSLVHSKYKDLVDTAIQSLIIDLPKYNCGYWSMYDAAGMISSPFYHNLHIAQMNALYMITGNDVFKQYMDLFMKYNNNMMNKGKAFLIKAYQKIIER